MKVAQTIQQVMIPAPYSVQASHHISVADKLMRDKHIRHLPVIDGKRVCGVLAMRDVESLLRQPGSAQATVSMAHFAEPVTMAPGTTLADAVKAMIAKRADIAIVVDAKERVVGVFTTIDALGLLVKLLDQLPPPAASTCAP